MSILASEVVQHVEHSLGSLPSSLLEPLRLVNLTGRMVFGMHPWQFLNGQAVGMAFEKDAERLRLPNDMGRIRAIRGKGSIIRHVEMTTPTQLAHMREWSASPRTGFHYAAISHRVPEVPNVLAWSQAFDESAAWSGTASVTADQAVDPYTGETTVDRITDDSTTAAEYLEQIVPVRYLEDGAYYAEVILRPNPLTTSRPKSAISLETFTPSDSGLQSFVEITWGETAWRDAPTLYLLSTNTGGATVGTPTAVGEGYWKIPIQGYTHSLAENYGRLYVKLYPSIAANAAADGTLDVTQTGAIEVVRAQASRGRIAVPYHENESEVYVPRIRRPYLEIHPTPSADESTTVEITYDGIWSDVDLMTDEIPLPSDNTFMEPFFLDAARLLAKGWEEEDEGALHQRFEVLERSRFYKRAKVNDGLVVPNLGAHEGGIGFQPIGMSGLATTVAAPAPRSGA